MSDSASKLKVEDLDGQQHPDTNLTVTTSDTKGKDKAKTTNVGRFKRLQPSKSTTPNTITNDSNENDENATRPTPSPPQTAFMCFSATKKNLDMERIAEEYNSLSPTQKALWEDESRKDKARYMHEKANHTGSWNIKKRRAKKHPLAPKRPSSAFLMYSQANRPMVKKKNPDLNNTDISRLLGQMWRRAPSEVKEPFQTRAEREGAVYKKNIMEWKLNQKRKEVEDVLGHREDEYMFQPMHVPFQPSAEIYRGSSEPWVSGSYYHQAPSHHQHICYDHRDHGPALHLHDDDNSRHHHHFNPMSRQNEAVPSTCNANSNYIHHEKNDGLAKHGLYENANDNSRQQQHFHPMVRQDEAVPAISRLATHDLYGNGHYVHHSRHIDGSTSNSEYYDNDSSTSSILGRASNDSWGRF